nr:hypothetical protein [Tanacetum cinerariifolium]
MGAGFCWGEWWKVVGIVWEWWSGAENKGNGVAGSGEKSGEQGLPVLILIAWKVLKCTQLVLESYTCYFMSGPSALQL